MSMHPRSAHPFPWHEGDLLVESEKRAKRARALERLREDERRFRLALRKIRKLPRGHGNAAIQIATIALLPRNLR